MTRRPAPPSARILLVDDGELDEVARVLDAQGLSYERRRGGSIPEQLAPPLELLIVTPRHVERVRRGSPAEAGPGRPLRIIAVTEDSPAMRRRLRRAGLHLLVRLPADAEIWRLLIARALYRGDERRHDERVAVVSPVALEDAAGGPERESTTLLLDLSNRGCRLQTDLPIREGEPLTFSLPAGLENGPDDEPLTLHGRVRRIAFEAGSELRRLAIVFDPAMPEMTRTHLTALINRWASGPGPIDGPAARRLPTLPPCRLAALPDLTLDDETDPPISARSPIRVRLAEAAAPSECDGDDERRARSRGRYESPILAESDAGPVVLIGRDLSAGGMRVEQVGGLRIGDRFRIALYGPGAGGPFVVDAEVARDDGEAGFALVFDAVDPATAVELEKLVACLPDVESLEAGEIGGLGAILSEIIRDE